MQKELSSSAAFDSDIMLNHRLRQLLMNQKRLHHTPNMKLSENHPVAFLTLFSYRFNICHVERVLSICLGWSASELFKVASRAILEIFI